MIQIPIKNSLILFWLLVFIDLAAVLLGIRWLHAIAKPMLMPALVLFIYAADVNTTGKKIIVTGLLFSWLGDLFLLHESRYSLFFIFGLASFFITHICYIIYFLSIRSTALSLLKKYPIYILLIIAYGTGLVWFLFPFLGTLRIPVILYATVICNMLLCSLHIFLKVTAPANWYFVAGALLFVLSDSLLATNKFYQPIPIAGTLIMLTYCGAQYFIVRGFVKLSLTLK